jgi:hypothetical protein
MELHGTFSPPQWQAIKADLAAVDIDIDAKLPPSYDRPPWLPAELSVRAAIQMIAWYYGARYISKKLPTPKQQAARLTKTLASYTEALDRTKTGGGDFLASQFQRQLALQGALSVEIAELEVRIARLNRGPSASASNAKTIRGDYWRDQTRVWLACRASGKFRRKHLLRFLCHCSEPIFGDVTETSIAAFIGHFGKCEQTNS